MHKSNLHLPNTSAGSPRCELPPVRILALKNVDTFEGDMCPSIKLSVETVSATRAGTRPSVWGGEWPVLRRWLSSLDLGLGLVRHFFPGFPPLLQDCGVLRRLLRHAPGEERANGQPAWEPRPHHEVVDPLDGSLGHCRRVSSIA